MIGTGNRVSGTQGSVPFLPELAERLTSLCLDWPPFPFPTKRDKNLFIQMGSDVLLLLLILTRAVLINLPGRQKSRAWVSAILGMCFPKGGSWTSCVAVT